MMLNTNERFTYTNMQLMDINRKLKLLDPDMKEPQALDLVNVSLVVFSIICDAHVNPELDRHEIAQNMIDDTQDFLYYTKDLIMQSIERNGVLNEYLNKQIDEVKK